MSTNSKLYLLLGTLMGATGFAPDAYASCPAGYYEDDGCQPCPIGTYCEGNCQNSDECIPCTDITYTYNGHTLDTDAPCTDFNRCPTTDSDASNGGSDCYLPAGTYNFVNSDVYSSVTFSDVCYAGT